MKKNRTLLILLLVLAVLLGGAYALYNGLGDIALPDRLAQDGTQPSETTGETEADDRDAAPDFTVYDADGGEVHLSDYAGKPVVLNFWASWCGPCRSEMPEFEMANQRLGGDVQFLMVNMTDGMRESVKTASEFVTEQGYTFPVVYDTALEAASAYGAYSLPTTYFIDSDGYVVAHAVGAIDGATLQKGIDMIFAGQ